MKPTNRTMDTTYNFHLGLAKERALKNETPNRPFNAQKLEKISTGISLVSLSLGFSVFGLLIIAHRHQADLNDLLSGSSVAAFGGIVSILVGTIFLVSAYLYWRMSKVKNACPALHSKRFLSDDGGSLASASWTSATLLPIHRTLRRLGFNPAYKLGYRLPAEMQTTRPSPEKRKPTCGEQASLLKGCFASPSSGHREWISRYCALGLRPT
jgi:hypothetical protein